MSRTFDVTEYDAIWLPDGRLVEKGICDEA